MSTSCLNTEDYNYLINNQDIITTCQEALLENDLSVPSVCQSDQSISGQTETTKTTKTKGCHDSRNVERKQRTHQQHAAERGRRKLCETSTAKVLVPGDSMADFADWLTGIEKQLDAICVCNPSGGKTGVTRDLEIVKKQKLIQIEIECVGRRFKSLISSQEFGKQETRWHSLWIRSLEFQMMLQDCNRCPNHSNSMLTSTGTNTDPLVNRVKGFLRSENVHKDIGYSSDAELSDAVDVRKNPAETTGDASAPVSLTSSSAVIVSNLSPSNSCRSSSQGRKRVIKRRQRSRDVKLSPSSSTGCLSMTSKRRPWSFHAASEWTDWDYYQPPSFAITAADHHPSDDLYINDENAIRSLIEFGENYEHWFRTDDGCVGLRASTPIQDSQDLLTGNNGRLRPPHHKCDCGRNATATPGAAGSETDTGKSSGCCLSDGEESNYSGEELEHDREASLAYSPLVANNRISFMTSEAGTECPSQVTNDAGTITTSISMCDSSTCTDLLVVPEEEEEIQSKPIISSPAAPVPRSRRPSSSFAYMIFFAFSIVSLFVSIFFADRPPHVQLSFTTPPPV